MRVCSAAAAVVLFLLPLPPVTSVVARAQTPAPLPSLSQPAISPDGKEIAFVSGSDIWTVAASGGEAHLLISDPAEDSRPLYSPDGKRLAFMSTRTGGGDLYVLTLATGQLQRITYSDSASNLDAWSRDGDWLYFTSSATDIAGQGDILRVRSSGGTPLEVSHERYLNEFESSPSPDGKHIALVAKGISSVQWWRNGHAHIDETEIWLKPIHSPSPTDGGYRKLISAEAKHAWPMWSPDGRQLLYMSDKGGDGTPGHENLWTADVANGVERQLTHFTTGRLLWPTLSYDGKTVVFERNFAVWTADAHTGKAEQVGIALRGLPSGPGVVHEPVTGWNDLALSPDGKKIAVAGHGEIFATGAKDGGDAQRLTHTEAEESQPHWNADSNEVVYRSERDGGSQLYAYSFVTNAERPIDHGQHPASDIDLEPTYSPDGKQIAFLRNRKELHVLTLATMADKLIATGEIDDTALAWSPDSHWLVYVPIGVDGFTNLWAVPADGSAPSREITFLANGENASHIAWSPDGKYILFDTSQRAEIPQLARVDLIPHVPLFREDQFRDLFRKQTSPGAPDSPADPGERNHITPNEERTPQSPALSGNDAAYDASQEPAPQAPGADAHPKADHPAAKKPIEPTKIVFEGIRERLTLLPVGLGVDYPVISPDGKTLAFLTEVADVQNIYTYPLDELATEPPAPRQITYTHGSKSGLAFSPDSKTLFYIEGGARRGNAGSDEAVAVRSIALENRTPKTIPITASLDVDFDKEKMVVFDEAWSTLDHRFFRADFNGRDWPALKAEWTPYIEGARTGGELRRDINLLIGELDSSHSGIQKPFTPAVRTGRLGVRFEREPFENSGALIIREIVPLGPVALEGSVHVGDRLLAVNGQTITPSTNLDELLIDAASRRVVLSIVPAGDQSKKRDVMVRPVTLQVESGLLYRAWVETRRAYVDKISGGKLGYVHIAAMGDADLAQLYLDLDVLNQARKGVVVDVRNNNGGYVNGRVIDVFARKNYLLMTPRDGATEPSRQSLGQRALGLPTVLVTNESTLSDGEDFTEGYRTLELGKIVGTPTAGWIIFTGAQRLIDGSAVRVPGDRIRTLADKDMEMHPRPVDVEQMRPLGETENGEDAQLQKAVQTLVNQLK